jgi:sulfite exporter TauE/SafE/copper chaperone CopZ
MNSQEKTINLAIGGMSCAACEIRIEKALARINGVVSVKASFARANVAVIIDEARVKPEQLTAAIVQAGYQVLTGQGSGADSKADRLTINQLLGIGIVLFAVYWIIRSTVGFNFIPQVDQSMGYGLLFVVGLLTSLHCIAMCGGINISQCVSQAPAGDSKAPKFAKFKPSLLYNGGRVLSYTIVGGLAGTLGSAVSFSGPAKGIVAILSGLLMVVIGVNMLDLFPGLRRFNISLPKFLGKKISDSGSHGPFLVGLLNGLMPCGPLQTVQLYALGTGSFLAGAASMFFFSLGTVPLMFGFGLLSSFLSGKFTHRMLKVSAILVIILGVIMMGRGLSLSGVIVAAPGSGGGSIATIEGNLQTVTTVIESGRYAPIVVQQGIPVRWIIKAKADDLNGCNNPIIVPKYNLEKRLIPGDNVIEFTPDAAGTIAYSCWMGMITSYIKVVPDLTQASAADLQSDGGGIGSLGGGGCCSAGNKATKFFNGNIPTDQIVLAQIVGGIQTATIIVNDEGYAPAVVVLQRGTKAKLKFNPERLNSCNNVVQFPEYGGQLDLSAGQLETPELEITQNFTFRCWMGMLNGYVKVVDDLNRVDLNAIRQEVKAYRPVNQGGGGCCGVSR